MLFLKAFSMSGNKDYLQAAKKCISFLKIPSMKIIYLNAE